MASGITTHLGPMPPIAGSMNVVKLLSGGLNDVVGAAFAVESDPEKAALFLRRHIESKRKALGLPALEVQPLHIQVASLYKTEGGPASVASERMLISGEIDHVRLA